MKLPDDIAVVRDAHGTWFWYVRGSYPSGNFSEIKGPFKLKAIAEKDACFAMAVKAGPAIGALI